VVESILGSDTADKPNEGRLNPDLVPAIETRNLVKRFGKRSSVTSAIELGGYLATLRGSFHETVTALDEVSLRVEQGEVFGLLGPNGAGKTTLIKILSTLVLPDSGNALVYGIDVATKPRAVLRKLQTVLAQSTGFELRLSGRRNLELYAALYGIPRDTSRKRIDSLIEFTKLGEWADSPFQTYSTGMARKLLVCRALLSDASLLIFDEPTSSLDPISAKEFRQFLSRDLVQEGRTIFMATHNLYEAEEICNRIALIEKGRVLVVGTPSQIRAMVANRVNLEFVLTGITDTAMRDLRERLSTIEGLVEVDARTNREGLVLSIVGGKSLDYNAIFELILKTGSRIESVEANEPSLEEAFLSLISRGQS
jgi:ABC-2 type transport system ATP-binding protein